MPVVATFSRRIKMSCMNRAALFTSIAGVVAFSPLQQGAACQNAAETLADIVEKKRSHRRLANTFSEVPTTGTDSVRVLAYKKIDEPETWARVANSSAEPARNSVAQTVHAVTEAVMAEPKTATTVATSTVASTSVANTTPPYPVAKPQLFLKDVPDDYLLASVNSKRSFRDWSVGSSCNKECDVRFRCYNLDKRDPETLWNDICQETGNLASYGYVDGDGERLYVIFNKEGFFKAENMACGFDTEMLARFNVIGWTNRSTLVLKAQDAAGRTAAIKALGIGMPDYDGMVYEWSCVYPTRDMPNVSVQFYNGNCYLVSRLAGKPLSNLTAEYKKNHSLCGAALYQLLLQLKGLHSLGIAHRDIKPSNMTLTDTGKVTLNGFDFACFGHIIPDIAGTDWYMAPECFEQLFKARIKQYDLYAADMYSLGITMCELFLGDSKKNRMPHLPTKSPLDRALSDLVHQMCRRKPHKRIAADSALMHGYFKLLGIVKE